MGSQAGRSLTGPSSFSGLILAGILTSALAMRQAPAKDWATMPPSFVIDFTALLLFGPDAAMFVAAAGIVAQALAGPQGSHPSRRMLVSSATVMVAIQAAGFAHRALGGTMGHFIWPFQGVPIASAVVAYCLVKSASAEIVVPFFTKQPINRSWPKSLLRGCPSYFIGASLAVGLVEVIDHRMWEVLPVAAVPLYFAYRAYSAHVNRLEEEHRRLEVIDSLDQGMSVVDSNGLVTLWNDALERILDCPRERALGRSLAAAVPVLAKTDLPRAISEALTSRTPLTLAHLGLPPAAGARTLHVRILPVVGGVTLLWHDVTERTRAEHALKRSEERLALAAEGANDGLWEWDLRSQEFYCLGPMEGDARPARARRHRSARGMDGPRPCRRHRGAQGGARGTSLRQDRCTFSTSTGSATRTAPTGGSCAAVSRRARRPPPGAHRRIADRHDGAAIAQEQLPARRIPRSADRALQPRGLRARGSGAASKSSKPGRVGSRFAALYLDLDRFKVVNDSLGHLVGDELLTAVSRRLESCLRAGRRARAGWAETSSRFS